MPVSIRQQALARKEAAMKAPETAEYVITDPNHHPDLRGEFAGARVYRRGEQQLVRLTPAQAQFYLDQGGLEPLNPPEERNPEQG
jgi:hypothetical protein